MPRLLLALVLLALAATARADPDYTDIWYDPAQAGYGYNVVQSNDGIVGADGKTHPFLFVTFFIFGPNNEPTWYSAELTWNGVDAFRGPAYKSTGTFFGKTWNPAENTAVAAGTATFKPSTANDYQATLMYVIDNVGSTTSTLERQTLTRNYTGGTYVGFELGKYDGSGCGLATNPTYYSDQYTLTVTDNSNTGGNVTLKFEYAGNLTCQIVGKYEQHGQLMMIRDGAYTCSDGANVKATAFDIRRTTFGIEGAYYSVLKPNCVASATFAGPYWGP